VPVFLIIVFVLLSERNGPVFYKSRRIGRYKKPFSMLKFRTMHPASVNLLTQEQRTEFKINFKIKSDPRITPVGRWLRRTSMDELPQFINVLRGEMSLVGPRPKLPEEIDMLGEHVDRLFSVLPGITGYWQIYRKTAASDSVMKEMELNYIQNRTLLTDFAILFLTPWRMIFFSNE
jgi:lipopolysaccharide/colanic/teichoic acid biosynthesis glycosyltransferase